ncbi:MAG TPA: GAF domain-containing protein [Prolixibacteraceae bacterium]|nr:GAF domain-containing protein [Prolixibacteraceae bacterium]
MIFDQESILEKVSLILSANEGKDQTLKSITKLLTEEVFHYDWVGFYFLDDNKSNLRLGPYTGASTEHTLIPVGKGVCGQVAQSGQPLVVQDVTQIENYLSCSLHVQSEIVVPILKDGKFVAEIDIDSHAPAPFTEADISLLEQVAMRLVKFF